MTKNDSWPLLSGCPSYQVDYPQYLPQTLMGGWDGGQLEDFFNHGGCISIVESIIVARSTACSTSGLSKIIFKV